MIKHFYSFIVETDTLFLEIDSLEISDSEKKHLKSLAESHIHHSILDSILSDLSPEDKKTFLKHLNSKDHTKTWEFLHERTKDIERKIESAVNAVKKELHRDIKEVKSKTDK